MNAHSHAHDDRDAAHGQESTDSRRLAAALALTAAFALVELIGGLIAGSLALIADAGHMITDAMALALAWVAARMAARPADARRSYGYHRFQIVAALVNGLTLIAIVAWIVVEAVERLMAPVDITADLMLLIAGLGLAVNIVVFVVLHGGSRDNLNLHGALLHVVGDLLGSVAAIVAGLVILGTGWMPIDPLLSLVVAGLILRSAWSLVKRSAHILLEGTPEWLDVAAMRRELTAAVREVCDIHHVHVWSLTPARLMLTMHVTIEDGETDPTIVIREVKRLLKQDYGIDHSTIEIEFGDCADEFPGTTDPPPATERAAGA
ncbi:MAG: cation diffusion facilitator family transporter [Gammaproteobacteria bacterium]